MAPTPLQSQQSFLGSRPRPPEASLLGRGAVGRSKPQPRPLAGEPARLCVHRMGCQGLAQEEQETADHQVLEWGPWPHWELLGSPGREESPVQVAGSTSHHVCPAAWKPSFQFTVSTPASRRLAAPGLPPPTPPLAAQPGPAPAASLCSPGHCRGGTMGP